jgi:hypothetical protein
MISKKKLNYLQNRLILNEILGKKNFVNFNGLSIESRTIKKKRVIFSN